MKNLLFLLLIIFAASSHADDLKKAQKTWVEFRACGKATKEKELDTCLKNTLKPGLDVLVQQKFSEFLLMKFHFSDLNLCTDADTTLPANPKKGDIYYCMAVLGHRHRIQGYATFEKYKDELRLTSIRY